MNLSKKLGPLLLAGSVLLLSACNGEEDPLPRKTDPAPIDTFQAVRVATEIGGLVMDDYLLQQLVSFAATDCASGNRTDTASVVPGYSTRYDFNGCRLGLMTYNGSVEIEESGASRHLQFNALTVETNYGGGALKLVITGALAKDRIEAGTETREDLAINQLTLDGSVTQYGRTSPVKVEIRDYLRKAQTNFEEGGVNTQSLQVQGRVTKSGDYGSYDVDFSNLPVDGADTLREIFQGTYAPNAYVSGRIHMIDRLRTSSFLALAPSLEVPAAGTTPAVPAGKFVHFTGKVGAQTYDALLDWGNLVPPFLMGIFVPPPSP